MEKPIFDYDSNFNPKANIGSVRFGANAPVLEVELNELQYIQDKAREDLIRSTIPSGFTKPVILDLEHQNSTSNNLIVAQDAEAYVNGMRIVIPTSTIIDIGESPTDTTREDLVFLEVWKEEVNGTSVLAEHGGDGQPATPNTMIDPRVGAETSRRIINRWRIRHVAGVDFNFVGDVSTIANCPDTYIGWIDDKRFSKAYAKGANKDLTMPTNINGEEVFRSANSNWITSQGFNDPTLWVAGIRGGANSLKRYKTVDGLVYAIPIFRLHRRPNSGFTNGDFSNISPIANPVKVAKLLESTKKISTGTGDLELKAEGKMFINILPDKETYDDGSTGWDKPTNSGYISANEANVPFDARVLAPNKDYTLVFDALIQGLNASKEKILRVDLFPDNFSEIGWLELTDTRTRYALNFRTPSDLTGLQSLRFYSGANTNVLLIKEVMLFEGTYTVETAPTDFFKGVSAVGDNVLTLDRFIAWEASITKGTAQDVIAQFPVTLNDPYLQVVPVDDKGNEIISGEIAFAILRDGNNVGWNAVNGKLRYDNFWKIQQIKVWCNNVAPTCKIKGFNIYTGGNLLVTANNLDNTKESVLNLKLKEPIRSINGRPDLSFEDGRVVRRVKKLILDEKCDWGGYVLTSKDGNYNIFQLAVPDMARTMLMSNMPNVNIYGDDHSTTFNREYLGVYKGDNTTNEWIYLCIESSKLAHPYVPDLKEYLKNKPITVYYEIKETVVSPTLPNGIEDYDDLNGNITRNIGVISKPKDLDWHFDAGVTQTATCMRICVEIPDKISIGTNNLLGNDVYCANIPTRRQSDTETRMPRLWSWWNSSIYIDVTADMIGVNFDSDSDSVKLQKFKKWLSNQGVIYYQKATPIIQTYPMDYAEVEGNLILDNDNYKVSVQGTTQPRVTMSYKEDLSLDLKKGKNYVHVDTQIAPTQISIDGESSLTKDLEINLDSNKSDLPVILKGNTIQNLIGVQYRNVGGTWNSASNTYIVDGQGLNDGYTIDFKVPLLKEKVTYTAICRVSNLSDSVKNDGIQIGILADNGTWNTNKYLNSLSGDCYVKLLLTPALGVTISGIRFRNKSFIDPNLHVSITMTDFMLLEGDWTQKEIPDYFSGVSSVGEIETNLFNKTLKDFQNGKQLGEAKAVYFNLKPNTQYICFSNVPKASQNSMIYFNNQLTSNAGVWDGNPRVVSTDETGQLFIAIRNTNYVDGLKMEDFFNGKYYIKLQEGSKCNHDVVAGKYKLGAISHGRNLCPISNFSTNEGRVVITKKPIRLKPNTSYAFSSNARLAILLSNTYVDNYINHDELYVAVVQDGKGYEVGCGTDGRATFNSQGYKYGYITTWIYSPDGVNVENIMLEEGTQFNAFEPYTGDNSTLYANEPLRGLNNEICDISEGRNGRGLITRVIGEYKVTGDENFVQLNNDNNSLCVYADISNIDVLLNGLAICNQFNYLNPNDLVSKYYEGVSISSSVKNRFIFRISMSKLPSPNITGFRAWLKANPTSIIYQLATPKLEILDIALDSNLGYEVNPSIKRDAPIEPTSGIDCGYFSITSSNLNGEWKTNQIIECTYEYPYGNMEDLVGQPLATDFGYKDETKYRFKLLKLLPNNKCLIQNIGKPNPSANRTFTLHSLVSTKMNKNSIVDLQKKVSLVGNDYNTVLEREICEHLY